jgi:Acetyltransferase (GNAT) domain
VPELQRLGAGHHPAVLAFELANRAYFAAPYFRAAMRSSTSSLSGTGPCWPSRRLVSAQHVAGPGVATTAVPELCRLAAARYGLRMLRAATTHDNVASQKVLAKAGFVPAGPAEPGGRPGT